MVVLDPHPLEQLDRLHERDEPLMRPVGRVHRRLPGACDHVRVAALGEQVKDQLVVAARGRVVQRGEALEIAQVRIDADLLDEELRDREEGVLDVAPPAISISGGSVQNMKSARAEQIPSGRPRATRIRSSSSC